MSTLQRAIELAVEAHAGQEDPPGEPYILHPMRVMLSLPDADHALRCVGILHDAVERGVMTLQRLRSEGFDEAIIEGVSLMTHDKAKATYADYVIALKPNRLARMVKLCDLADNANLKYVDFPADQPRKGKRRTARYALSYAFLTDHIDEKSYRSAMEKAE